jgi:hypothetical protein
VLATPGNMTYAQMKQYVNFLPKELGANATPAQIRDYITAYHGVGVFGQYDYHTTPQRGIGVDSVIMVRWSPDKGTWIGVSKAGGG